MSLSPGRRDSGLRQLGQAVGNRQARRRRLGPVGTGGQHRADHLGDHVAGLAHHHGVPRPDVFGLDLVLVVEGGHRHRRTANEHRLEHGEGGGLAGAPYGHRDVPEQGGALLGGKLVGDGPPGRPRGGPQLALEDQVVDLHHHPVDLVVQLVAIGLPPSAELEDGVEPLDQGALRVDREPGPVQPGQGVRVGGGQLLGQGRGSRGAGLSHGQLTHLVGPERQGPVGRDRGVLLTERAGRRVAGVDELTTVEPRPDGG